MKYSNQDVIAVSLASDSFQRGATGDNRLVFIQFSDQKILPIARTIALLKQQSANYARGIDENTEGKSQVDSILEVAVTL